MVMRFQQGQQELSDRVGAEVRRHVADPEPPIGRTLIGMGLNTVCQGFGEPLVPAAVFVANCRRVAAGAEIEGVQKITLYAGKVGLDL